MRRNRLKVKYLIDLSYIKPYKRYFSISIYGLRLISALPSEDVKDIALLIHPNMMKFFHENYPQYERIELKQPQMLCKIKILDSICRYLIYRRTIHSIDYNVLLTLDEYRRECLICKKGTKKVSVIHDLKGLKREKNHKPFHFYRRLIKSSDKIIAVSNYTKEDILSHYEVSEGKIAVVYNGVAIINHSEKPKNIPEGRYILYVNSLREGKNPLTLIKAFSLLQGFEDVKLILVGREKAHWHDCLLPYIQQNGLSQRVVRLESISSENLRYLYENAILFVTTSLHEGFGYTPIEAAIYGCPVVSSKCEALPDTTRMLLNYYEPATDEIALRDKIMEVLTAKKDEHSLLEVSTTFKKAYSPQKQADAIVGIMKELIDKS